MKHISESLKSESIERIIAKMPPHLQEICRERYRAGRAAMQAANTIADWNRRNPDDRVEAIRLEALRVPEVPERAPAPADLSGIWTRSGLERHEQNWSLDYLARDPGKKDALGAARLIARGDPVGLATFYGQVGRGKSGVLKALVAAFIRRGIPARYLKASDILQRVRSTFGRSDSTEEGLIREYAGVKVLAMDEFDLIPETDFSFIEIRSLLDLRYDKRFTQLTLLATNAQPDAMPQHWEFMVSRMQSGERILVGGGDLRVQRPMRLAGKTAE